MKPPKALLSMLLNYEHGILGVYMVPPMFYGEVPEAVVPSKFDKKNQFDRMKGQKISEGHHGVFISFKKKTKFFPNSNL